MAINNLNYLNNSYRKQQNNGGANNTIAPELKWNKVADLTFNGDPSQPCDVSFTIPNNAKMISIIGRYFIGEGKATYVGCNGIYQNTNTFLFIPSFVRGTTPMLVQLQTRNGKKILRFFNNNGGTYNAITENDNLEIYWM